MKTQLIVTRTISYQFQTLIQRIDTEFYCGSRGMICLYIYIYIYIFDKILCLKKSLFLKYKNL